MKNVGILKDFGVADGQLWSLLPPSISWWLRSWVAGRLGEAWAWSLLEKHGLDTYGGGFRGTQHWGPAGVLQNLAGHLDGNEVLV